MYSLPEKAAVSPGPQYKNGVRGRKGIRITESLIC